MQTQSSKFPRLSRPLALACTLVTGLVVGFGCSPSRKAQTQTPEPNLCDLDGGQYCRPCDVGQCPQGDSGWLCCVNGICVAVATAGDCGGGTIGWCTNYTTQKQCLPSGWCTETAICHDEQ